MKHFLLFLLVAFAATVVAHAQTPTGPVMTLEVTTIDYGTIEKGADPIRKFKFTNTGTEPLVIKSGQGSCGCTVPSFPREAINPGESNVIEVRYDTQRVGPFSKTVTLLTNETQGTHTLTIQGEVKAPTAPIQDVAPVSAGAAVKPE